MDIEGDEVDMIAMPSNYLMSWLRAKEFDKVLETT